MLVTPANESDGASLKKLIEPIYKEMTRFKKLFLDDGYKEGCVAWIGEVPKWEVEKISIKEGGERGLWAEGDKDPKITKPGFVLKPKRWVVERTFAWMGRYRRLSKDYEAKRDTEEAWVLIAISRLVLYRLDSP